MYLLETGKVDIRYEGRTLETVESGGNRLRDVIG